MDGGSDAVDAVDAALPPSGKPLWAYGFGGADDDDAVAVAVEEDRAQFLVHIFSA